MKKIIPIVTAILLAAVCTSCGGISESGGFSETASTGNSESNSEGRSEVDRLLSEVNEYIDLFEYNKAVKIMEENQEICRSEKFDGARAELKKHFAQTAKNYYKAAATYVTKMEIMGYDYKTGFEGYNPANGTLDPAAITEAYPGIVDSSDELAAKRVTIVCDNDAYIGSFKVTVDFCGMTAVYPAEDIELD